MLKFRTILHPTDFSEAARAAFELACSLARDHGAEIVVLNVLPAPLASVSTALQHHDASFRGAIIKQMKDSFTSPDIKMDYHLRTGDPAEEILHYAPEVKCDLIVMGTHGRGGLWRMAMGSVAEEVSRRADCPVLTVRNPTAEVKTDNPAAPE